MPWKFWKYTEFDFVEDKKVSAFLQDIIKTCRKRGLCLTPAVPEDGMAINECDEVYLESLLQSPILIGYDKDQCTDFKERVRERLECIRRNREENHFVEPNRLPKKEINNDGQSPRP